MVVGSNGYKMGLRKIQFDDLNFDEDYSGWNAYNQSKLAQMTFAYELQRGVRSANSDVQVQVCHPGMSRTELIQDDVTLLNKILFRLMSPLAQSAEKGSWPEVMCATEGGLQPETLYGPTKRADTVGPIGECPLEDHAIDQDAATKLWTLSEDKTAMAWSP